MIGALELEDARGALATVPGAPQGDAQRADLVRERDTLKQERVSIDRVQAYLADRVGIISSGLIVAEDTPAKLKARARHPAG